jgi:hypothetical protein
MIMVKREFIRGLVFDFRELMLFKIAHSLPFALHNMILILEIFFSEFRICFIERRLGGKKINAEKAQRYPKEILHGFRWFFNYITSKLSIQKYNFTDAIKKC